MEAATPLRQPHVRTIGDRLVVDGLVVEDECAVRLVREREKNSGDPVRVVRDAVEIGARVLDREQAGANTEFAKAEFEKASRDVQHEFTEKARTIAEFFEAQFAAVFGEDDGQLAKELERRFGDGSAVSVQNRVREAVAETLTKSREDLVRQFSAADERNPLADFKSAAVREIQQAASRSDATQRALLTKLGELQKELQGLRDEKVDEVFGEENGHLAKELEKLFSDGSSASVQNRVRELVGETLAKSREDLVRQFSSSDGSNPLADFKAGTVRELRQAHVTQQAMVERMAELEKQLQGLRIEREAERQVAAERERGTAKGRTFEEQVAEAVDLIATVQGDCSEAVGDLPGATGKTGDVVVDLAAADGPARGRLVFEAKDSKLPRPEAIRQLDRALEQRDADFAVLVVPDDDEVPARMQTLREYNGDKLIVTLDTEDDAHLALELGYRLARARVLMDRAGGDGIDAGAVRGSVERARQAVEDVRKVKSQLTGATTNISNARELVEALADRVKAHLDEVEQLVSADAPAKDAPTEPPQTTLLS